MNQPDTIKKADQIALLEACRDFANTGEWKNLFTYPNCGWDLVQQGLVTEDRKITKSGLAVLWFLDKGDDPTNSKSFQSFSMPLPDRKSPEDTHHEQ